MADVIAGALATCVLLIGLLALTAKVISLLHRLVGQVRGEPAVPPVLRPSRPVPGAIFYRTRNGRADYRFLIRQVPNDGYRVYILDPPDYGTRSIGNLATHQLQDATGHYICWTQRLNSEDQARRVAALWADKTEDYILNGIPF